MKKFIALLLVITSLLALMPSSLAQEQIRITFDTAKITFTSGESTVLVIKASRAPEKDLPIIMVDSRKNTYPLILPAGQTQLEFPIDSEMSETGFKTTYTLRRSDDFFLASPHECVVTAKAVTMYSFGLPVYQTYVDRQLSFKIRVANGDRLANGTIVTLRDQDGNVLETIEHNQRRTAYNFTYDMDPSWFPGKTLSVWVGDRKTADASALMAVGVSGGKSIYGVRRDDKKLAFTMDCGSGADNLPEILDILDEFGLKITFFMTGTFAFKNQDMVKEVAARGHEIGNHSWSHPSFYNLKPEEMISQLTRTSDLIESLTGKPTNLFRPPEGNCNSKIRAIVNAAGYEVIRWTHESYDARREASPANSLKYSTKDVKGGSIILTHIDADCTVSVLRDIFQWYKDNGFEVVTVSEILHSGNTTTDENGLQYVIE